MNIRQDILSSEITYFLKFWTPCDFGERKLKGANFFWKPLRKLSSQKQNTKIDGWNKIQGIFSVRQRKKQEINQAKAPLQNHAA